VAITGANAKRLPLRLAARFLPPESFLRLWEEISARLRSVLWIRLGCDVDGAGGVEFQLETIVTFRPRIAVILNITPDHLDRHKTFANYVNAKARVFENQGADDFTVLNADDPRPLDWRGEREGS